REQHAYLPLDNVERRRQSVACADVCTHPIIATRRGLVPRPIVASIPLHKHLRRPSGGFKDGRSQVRELMGELACLKSVNPRSTAISTGSAQKAKGARTTASDRHQSHLIAVRRMAAVGALR